MQQTPPRPCLAHLAGSGVGSDPNDSSSGHTGGFVMLRDFLFELGRGTEGATVVDIEPESEDIGVESFTLCVGRRKGSLGGVTGQTRAEVTGIITCSRS